MKGWENFDPANRGAKKDPKRQLQGALSRRQGAAFEDYLKAACEHYKRAGAADIEKTPEPMKVLYPLPGQPGRFVCCFEKTAQPDFKGTLRGGRCIVFDAKLTGDDRIEQQAVTEEQEGDLARQDALGAVSCVVVSLRLRSFYRVPWATWAAMKSLYGRKYMTAEDLAPYAVPLERGIIKFLGGIVDAENCLY